MVRRAAVGCCTSDGRRKEMNSKERTLNKALMRLHIMGCGAGEILIRISACGVCHTELDEIECRTPPPHLPIILGHQAVGKVYTQVIPDAKAATLMPIIKDRIAPDSIVYSDSLPSYNALDISDFKHYRINHSKLFADKKNHINGIENFWNQAKRHMRQFNGVPKQNFNLFLKECEFRFNNPSPKKQLQLLKQWIKLRQV